MGVCFKNESMCRANFFSDGGSVSRLHKPEVLCVLSVQATKISLVERKDDPSLLTRKDDSNGNVLVGQNAGHHRVR